MRNAALNNLTILDILETINKRYSDKIALQIKTKEGFRGLSYIELGKRTVDVSSTLIKLGIEKNDRVAILSESRPEWGIAFFGIISCGGIVVPLDIKLSEKEVEFILNDSEARCIFVSEKYLKTIDNIKSNIPNLKHIILLDESDRDDVMLLKNLKLKEGAEKNRYIGPNDTALIVYTSGTTGVAKGVELTYKNLLFQIYSLNGVVKYTSEDNFLSILPLNHMLEITGGFISPLYVGATITYCDSLKPTNIMALMQETHTTTMISVPLVLKMFHDGIVKKAESLPNIKRKFFFALLHLSRFLLEFKIRAGKLFFGSVHKQFGGKLKCFVSGGAPLDPVVEMDFNALGLTILQGYGLTETSPVITVNSFEERKYGSVGKPLPGVEVKILANSETGVQEGEIITKGPHVMRGYYKNSIKTQEVLRDGWFYTGDIGYFDEDGFLYISGRIKNLIVLGAGKKVFPEEVEEVMSASPYIKDICVLGRVADRGIRKGCEEVYAVVVPNFDIFDKSDRYNKELIKKKIAYEISRLGANLAEYKRIMDFTIWDEELPKTSTRKIKRKALLELISKKEAEETDIKSKDFLESSELIEDNLSIKLRQILSRMLKIPAKQIKPHSNLYNDLGVDSLMKVEILIAIEKEESINIPERLIYEINTFGDLIRFTKEYKIGRGEDDRDIEEEVAEIIQKNVKFKLTHNLSYFILRGLFSLYFRKSVYGIENLPSTKSFIIAANHSSMLDFPIILTSLPFSKMKDVLAPAAKDYFYTKATRKTIIELLFNTFPFERMGDFIKGLKVCKILLKKGKSIILFPEGTRSKEGTLKSFKPGIGSLSFELGVPIIPVYIKGAFETLPKGKVLPRPKKISVYFGKAIYAQQSYSSNLKTNYEKYVHLAKSVYDEIEKLQMSS